MVMGFGGGTHPGAGAFPGMADIRARQLLEIIGSTQPDPKRPEIGHMPCKTSLTECRPLRIINGDRLRARLAWRQSKLRLDSRWVC